MNPAITIENHGSIVLFRANVQEARDWLASIVPDDAQWLGNALVVEPLYAADIIAAIYDDTQFQVEL